MLLLAFLCYTLNLVDPLYPPSGLFFFLKCFKPVEMVDRIQVLNKVSVTHQVLLVL